MLNYFPRTYRISLENDDKVKKLATRFRCSQSRIIRIAIDTANFIIKGAPK